MKSDSDTAIGRMLERFAARLPFDFHGFAVERPFALLCLRIAVLLGLFLMFEAFIMRASRLPATAYEQPFLIVELVRRIGLFASVLLALAVAVLVCHGRLMLSWSELDNGRALRFFVVFLALLMAWPLTTYGYNYYLGQGHYLDRVILATLVALLWLRPAIIYPFLLLAFALLWQFGVPPLGGTIFAHKLQVLHVLNMFAAFLALRVVTGRRGSSDFMFMTCCLVAAAYWLPALAKLQLNWLADVNLHLMPLAAYGHGWLSFVEPAAVVRLSQWIAPLNLPLALFVLAIESLCLVFLWRRALSIWLLAAVIAFHLGVFAFYGFLFWPWIALDAGLLILLARDLRTAQIRIYTRGHLLLSVILIGLAAFWARPPALGWYDTSLTYTYRIDAVGADGDRFTLPPTFFAPYEDVFMLMSFPYLISDHAVLVGPYGVTKDPKLAQAINDADSSVDVFELELQAERIPFDASRAQKFYDFLERFASNRNLQGQRLSWLASARAPRQFWDFADENRSRSEREIREIIVTEITMIFDGSQMRVIRESELNRVPVRSSG